MNNSFLVNKHARLAPLEGKLKRLLGKPAINEAEAAVRCCPSYEPTPLTRMRGLGKELGLSEVWLKDERSRFGLGSFKALGGAYAVLATVAQNLGCSVVGMDPLDEKVRAQASKITFCAATDGNHGRAVAAGARLVGARCVIFVHSDVNPIRVRALADLNAQIITVKGDYDDAVRACSIAAADNGWIKVADTIAPGDDETIPAFVLQGYGVMVREALRQMAPSTPSHILVQAGVGGLAASVAAVVAEEGLSGTKLIIVEPVNAACLLEAVRIGGPTELTGSIDTSMAMLSCGCASALAWEVLADRAFAYLTIDDMAAEATARALAGASGPERVSLGLSGAAGVAGLQRAIAGFSKELELKSESCVLLFGTERDIEGDLKRSLSG